MKYKEENPQPKPCFECQSYHAKDVMLKDHNPNHPTPCSYCWKHKRYVCAVLGTCGDWASKGSGGK